MGMIFKRYVGEEWDYIVYVLIVRRGYRIGLLDVMNAK